MKGRSPFISEPTQNEASPESKAILLTNILLATFSKKHFQTVPCSANENVLSKQDYIPTLFALARIMRVILV